MEPESVSARNTPDFLFIMSKPQRYLILPSRGLAAKPANASVAVRDFLLSLDTTSGTAAVASSLAATVSEHGGAAAVGPAKRKRPFELVASLHEDGVKLVTTTPEMVAAMRYTTPGLRIVPERFCRPAVFLVELRARPAKASTAKTALVRRLEVEVIRADTGQPLRGVGVIGFTDFANRVGEEAVTKANGRVTLSVPGNIKRYERLYVQHDLAGLWTFFAANVDTRGSLRVALQPVDLAVDDSLRHFHQIGADDSGHGVKVGVIDSGIAENHPDLKVTGGLGCVPDEPEADFGPHGSHGTHVAGIIAGGGRAPAGMRGIAPAVELFSYRVFGDSSSSGSNFALVKAIERGIEDKCDLLNMSLGFDLPENGIPEIDEAVQEAIRTAHKQGVVVVAAAGNDGRKAVNYPACDDLAIAVSAVGRIGTFPTESSETADVMSPFGTSKKDFIAAFSNIGTALDATGAGVGVISTVPPDAYAPMSGTSMACPAVTGVLARLLANAHAVLQAPRDSNRADAIKTLLFDHAKTLGFKLAMEGKGLPR